MERRNESRLKGREGDHKTDIDSIFSIKYTIIENMKR